MKNEDGTVKRNWWGMLRDTSGTTAVIFGIVAIPTFMILGMAIDYGIATSARAKLDAAADAAAMVAVTTAKGVIQGSTSGSTASVTASAIQQGEAMGVTAFNANAGSVGYATVPTPTVTVTRVNQTLTANVSYSTNSQTTFGNILGVSVLPLATTSAATLTMPTYINYYVLVDTSQSMGVGSTPSDMQTLYNRVVTYNNWASPADQASKTGCVFGCHVPQVVGSYTQPVPNETLAHSSKYGSFINLRVDAAKTAIQSIVSLAQIANQQSGQNLVQIGVYTLQQDPTSATPTYMTTISAPSANLSNASPPNPNTISTDPNSVSYKVNTIDLGNNTGAGIGDTSLTTSLNYFNSNILTQQGDGTQSSPLKYVFVITDGVQDVPGACTDGHCTAVLDYSNACTPLKAKATVGVIYTTYNPVYVNNDPNYYSSSYPDSPYVNTYHDLVLPFASQIAPSLQNCSSGSQWYFEASDGPAITTGMQKLFAPTLQAARVSQ